MEEFVLVAVAPFYGLAIVGTCYAAAYSFHCIKKFDQSASETRDTETVK